MRGLRLHGSAAARVGWAIAICGFLVTRLVFLDRDLPPWGLAHYQPIDESAYTIPAFNLHLYGTWTHQDVPWIPLEGSPMNVLQSLVTAVTLALDWSYWGFRASSVLFGLIAFLALLAVVRHLVREAEADAEQLPFPGTAVLAATTLLLLIDFSFLLGGRVVEATIPRLATVSVLLWLVSRGTLFGSGHTRTRSLGLGVVAGTMVGFGYIYNAFMLPGALLAILAWGWGRLSRRELIRHLLLAAFGMALSLTVYFGWVYAQYGTNPAEWYELWLSRFRETGRATGFDLTALWDLFTGNLFRLDRPLFALTLLVLPVFAWWTVRSRSPLGTTVLALAGAFAAQCTIQSDYPQRKMLLLLAFAIPIAVGGLLRLSSFLDSIRVRNPLRITAAAWLIMVVLGTLVLLAPPDLSHWRVLARVLGLPAAAGMGYRVGDEGRLLFACALAGVAATVVLAISWRHARRARITGIVLLVAMLLPLVALDLRYVFTNVTTAYRDAMRSVASLPDHSVIGGSGHAMLLYNDAKAVLQGNVYGMTVSEYEVAVVRYYAEGRARWMFGYADGAGRARWTPRGFRLVETYPIDLPKGRILGRYEYIGRPAE